MEVMNLDHPVAWVAGSICGYVLAVYAITEAAAWNRRRVRRAAANRARRDARIQMLNESIAHQERRVEVFDFALWELELGYDLPVIDITEEW